MFKIIIMDKTLAVDFETTYDKTVSIKPLGWDGYFRHPKFEAYLVAIKGSDGFEWLGHPAECPWNRLAEEYPVWISHNAAFDENLYHVARGEGWWDELDGPINLPAEWHCTMDLVAFSGHPHSLKNAVKSVFNIELSKEVRDSAAGKRPPNDWYCANKDSLDHWEPMDADAWDAMLKYAMGDSEWCLKLWDQLAPKWPVNERTLSVHTREIARNGIPVDVVAAEQAARDLRLVLHGFESCIPWTDKDALLSRAAFDRQCLKDDLAPPRSLAQDDPDAEVWFEAYEDKHQWIYAYRNWRKANTLLKKVEALIRASREVDGHYRYFGGMTYCGAHTRRWSGKGGNLNLQNPPKGTQHFRIEVDGDVFEAKFKFRDLIRAPKGKKIMAVDLSQIEVRTLVWVAKDKETLQRIKDTPDIYQTFAEDFGLWSPESGILSEEDNDLRQMIKATVLGSGFGASAWAFKDKYAWALEAAVKKNYPEDDEGRHEAAMKWLEFMKKDVGMWWWSKAGRLMKKNAMVDVVKKTASGREFTVQRPQWKEYAKWATETGKKLERYADVPVKLDRWEWDIDAVLTMKEATFCVGLYRDKMKSIRDLWKRLRELLTAATTDRFLELTLPSGNVMKYKNVRRVQTAAKDTDETENTILCNIIRNGRFATMKPWHGLLAENLAQSLARDVFGEGLLRLRAAGFKILFHVHDEVVMEVPEETAEKDLRHATALLSVSPDWIKSLPVAAEGKLGNTYSDCK